MFDRIGYVVPHFEVELKRCCEVALCLDVLQSPACTTAIKYSAHARKDEKLRLRFGSNVSERALPQATTRRAKRAALSNPSPTTITSLLSLFLIIEILKIKKIQRKLKESEKLYKILINSLPQRIYYKDINSAYVSCNENMARSLGIDIEEVRGKTDYSFFEESLAEKYRNEDREIVIRDQKIQAEEKIKFKERIICFSSHFFYIYT